MVKISDILRYLETIAPVSMKMDWDNVGLLCGDETQEVKKILVALDPFYEVCQEAAAIGADLIVTHHPLIFRPVSSVTEQSSVGKCIRFLIQKNIAAVNAHTNLDCAPGGVNDCLAATLGLEKVSVLEPQGLDAKGRPWGLLRVGEIEETPLAGFLERVEKSLGCPGIRYADGGRPVRHVAVGGGACADELQTVRKAGCDTFVTADVKYNQFWDAQDMGLNLIDAGHFYTENPVCRYLVEKLAGQFPGIVVELSKNHGDCMKFYKNS